MLANLPERAEVDLQQHRNDHQPDQRGDRQIHLGDLGCADDVEDARHKLTECDADDDAEEDPDGQVAFERGHDDAFCSGRGRPASGDVDDQFAVFLAELAELRRK